MVVLGWKSKCSVYEDVARDTNRGHTVHAVCDSFHLAKDAGFKVVAHMMPDLERDIEGFIVSVLHLVLNSTLFKWSSDTEKYYEECKVVKRVL